MTHPAALAAPGDSLVAGAGTSAPRRDHASEMREPMNITRSWTLRHLRAAVAP